MRHLWKVLAVLAAMCFVAVPTAVAQSPAADQYQPAPAPSDDGGNAPDIDSGGNAPDTDPGGNAPDTDAGGNAPVPVANVGPAAEGGKLPFTGGQISLIALLGLALLAAGTTGLAISRRRGASKPNAG